MQLQFYTDISTAEKLQELISDMVIGNWSTQEIRDYFATLGYDIFFINDKVQKAIWKANGFEV